MAEDTPTSSVSSELLAPVVSQITLDKTRFRALVNGDETETVELEVLDSTTTPIAKRTVLSIEGQIKSRIGALSYDFEQAKNTIEATEVVLLNAKDDTIAARDAAQTSESNALSHANTAETHKDDARTYRNQAQNFKNSAETSATNAASSEDLAQKWAEENEDVEVETGLYSAKHYALKAEGSLSTVSSDADLAQKWAEENEDVEVETGLYSAKHYALKAEGSLSTVSSDADLAQRWADENEDVEVITGAYSAKHHALKAAESESNAATSESNAQTYSNEAEGYRNEAKTYHDNLMVEPYYFPYYMTKSVTSTGNIDVTNAAVNKVDGTTNTTISFVDDTGTAITSLPTDRAQNIIIFISGAGGSITWPSQIEWSGGNEPTLGTTWTSVIVFWTGNMFIGITSGKK